MGPDDIYLSRADAAEKLLPELEQYRGADDVQILAVPKGGVPIGAFLAEQLNLPFNVIAAKKVCAPFSTEFSIGAVSEDHVSVIDSGTLSRMAIREDKAEEMVEKEHENLQSQVDEYRNGVPLLGLGQKTIILVDDGIATGITMQAAIESVRKQYPKKIVVAIPIGSPEAIAKIHQVADTLICPLQPKSFHEISDFYQDFPPITNTQAITLIRNAHAKSSAVS